MIETKSHKASIGERRKKERVCARHEFPIREVGKKGVRRIATPASQDALELVLGSSYSSTGSSLSAALSRPNQRKREEKRDSSDFYDGGNPKQQQCL